MNYFTEHCLPHKQKYSASKIVVTASFLGLIASISKKVAVNQGGAGEYLLLKVLEKENILKEKVQRVYLSPKDK